MSVITLHSIVVLIYHYMSYTCLIWHVLDLLSEKKSKETFCKPTEKKENHTKNTFIAVKDSLYVDKKKRWTKVNTHAVVNQYSMKESRHQEKKKGKIIMIMLKRGLYETCKIFSQFLLLLPLISILISNQYCFISKVFIIRMQLLTSITFL